MSVWKHNHICEPNNEGNDPLSVGAEDSINYGTHTLPKKFWQGIGSILRDPGFLARRAAKSLRTPRNRAERAEDPVPKHLTTKRK